MDLDKAAKMAVRGPIHARSGVFCLPDREHIGSIHTITSSNPERNVNGRVTAAVMAHAYNLVAVEGIIDKARRLISLIEDDASRYEAWKDEVEALDEVVGRGENVTIPEEEPEPARGNDLNWGEP